MSISLRTSASIFFGVPPIFKRRDLERAAKPAARRIEPSIGVKPTAAPARPGKAGAVDFDKLLAATRKAPVDLAPIEWEGDGRGASAAQSPAANAPDSVGAMDDACGTGARTRRIRDRYIGARFPGVARSASDLENPERVVKCARLYFEDGQLDAALELLDMAIEQDSRAEALWLAQLEILFLSRDAARFVECARAFRALHGASGEWAEVARLGHAIAPREGLFGQKAGPRGHEHYGPWPDLPNWIQASWDLTAEVLASDFHRLMKRRQGESRA
ncbi:MAG TPA: hypothetical protein VH301_18120 [Usitatibacter sp.]|jgi:hypothetical protein|nr:hypothetical protein [Usitatibacter sp.]